MIKVKIIRGLFHKSIKFHMSSPDPHSRMDKQTSKAMIHQMKDKFEKIFEGLKIRVEIIE